MEKKASTIIGIIVLSITFIAVMGYGMIQEKNRELQREENIAYNTTIKKNTTTNSTRTTNTNTTNTTNTVNTINEVSNEVVTNTNTTTNTMNTEKSNDILIKNVIAE